MPKIHKNLYIKTIDITIPSYWEVPKVYKKYCAIITIVLLCCLSFQSQARNINQHSYQSTVGTTWYVGGSGPNNHSTIQEAIINASNGDTIYVYAASSPYYEHISVYKDLDIIGEDKQTTIIDGNGSGTIVSISENGVLISDFTIKNGKTGIEIDGSTDNISITRNIIIDFSDEGINVNGINEFVYIEYNVIRNCKNGSELAGSSYGKINGNSFENNEIALVFNLLCNQNQIHLNNFLNNDKDVFFYSSVLNSWLFNYWDRPRILPKPIFGLIFFIPWVNFDWRPLFRPTEI